jgi:hypothetical protein
MRFSFRSKQTYELWHGGLPPCQSRRSAHRKLGSEAFVPHTIGKCPVPARSNLPSQRRTEMHGSMAALMRASAARLQI